MHKARKPDLLLRELAILRPEDIDLEAIAWSQGAKVKYRDLDGCEACIRGSAELGRAIISIQDGAFHQRQRFSLAHEIGHWEWHRGQQLMCQKDDIGGNWRRSLGAMKEKAANQFAAGLLMPGDMLKVALRDFRKFSMRAISEIASTFDVSKTAMAYRLTEQDYEPCVLVSHTSNGRQWFVRSKSIGHRWFPNETLDPQSTAYYILHNGAEDDRSMSTLDADSSGSTSHRQASLR